MDRQSIRKTMRAQRRSLNSSQQKDSAANLLGNLNTQDWYLHAGIVAGYLSNDGEIDLTLAINDLAARKKLVTLPKVESNLGQMQFQFWTPGDPLIDNRYGISEPASGKICDVSAHSLILTPLVAFDADGNRVGMGGGYYDRSLKNSKSSGGGPLIVGVAYDFQQFDALSAEPWDVPLDAVITDKKVIPISAKMKSLTGTNLA